ncbi:hypothetical protein AAG570_004377 [Ranatra chinensis]|uniref:Uncharacterized protein n=1 Tax=Ranatra chinensis TaxID=642074 RepID=A0ABD0YIW8_9HEMI
MLARYWGPAAAFCNCRQVQVYYFRRKRKRKRGTVAAAAARRMPAGRGEQPLGGGQTAATGGGGGGSYRSLSGDVYRSTTLAASPTQYDKFSVIESFKKVFNSVTSSATVPSSKQTEPLLHQKQAIIVPRKMPTSAAAEETALLG